jgi:hypothetical protein
MMASVLVGAAMSTEARPFVTLDEMYALLREVIGTDAFNDGATTTMNARKCDQVTAFLQKLNSNGKCFLRALLKYICPQSVSL